MEPAAKLAVLAAGLFFLNALGCGVWKYVQIRASVDARAHPYVDTAHRASLLYSFAALLLARFVELSDLSPAVELAATGFCVAFFAVAIFNYMLHGALRDTDNVFDRSKGSAAGGSSEGATAAFMALLIFAEVGGFLVLFWGFARAQLF